MSIVLGKTLLARQLVFPSVMLLCLMVQNRLWKCGRDQAATHFLVGGLVAATAVSLGVNGIYAPAVVVPVVSTLLAGYLLGGGAAWGYGTVNLTLVWLAFGAHQLGWTFRMPPPEHIWFGILVVMVLVASISLLILLRGMKSAALLQDRERDSLASAAEALHRRQAELEIEVGRRTRELELANAELSEFSRAVSHDLQGPLRSVRRFSEILSEHALSGAGASAHDQPRQKILEDISRHAEAMEVVLERTLCRSRPKVDG
jgi:signal transduction histidine kinase